MSIPSDRLGGWLLISGMVAFSMGALFWRLSYQAPVLADALRSVAEDRWRWLWIHAWMAAGVVLTVAGLTAWVEIQRRAGESTLTPIAVVAYLLGAVLWLVAIGSRVTIQTWAASEVLTGAGVPASYPAVHRFLGVLYAGHMLLSYVSAALLGAGVLSSHVVSNGAGWAGVIGGGVASFGFVLFGGGPFAPPLLAHVYSCTLGILLLRLR